MEIFHFVNKGPIKIVNTRSPVNFSQSRKLIQENFINPQANTIFENKANNHEIKSFIRIC